MSATESKLRGGCRRSIPIRADPCVQVGNICSASARRAIRSPGRQEHRQGGNRVTEQEAQLGRSVGDMSPRSRPHRRLDRVKRVIRLLKWADVIRRAGIRMD